MAENTKRKLKLLTMYKSYRYTSIYKYFFPVFMLGGVFFGIYMSWVHGTPESLYFAKSTIVLVLWIGFFLVQMPFRLKRIEALENGIKIYSFRTHTFIEYKDIEWITKFDITSPFFITIKYHDSSLGVDRKIAYMPNQKDQRFFKDDEMTNYIKNKLVSINPNYLTEKQPSQIKNFLILISLGLPFAIIALYFMGEFNGII